MDYQAAGFWVACGALGLSLLATIVACIAWWGKRERVTQAALNRIEQRSTASLAALDVRMTRVETEFGHLLTVDALNKALEPLYVLARGTERRAAELDGNLRHINDSLNTLINKILDRGLT
jgi:methyl-accepting chemotaxis protein